MEPEAIPRPLAAGSFAPGVERGVAGQIYRLSLRNFMCHENLSVEFNRHVNVISGTNGSGKSAMLQALQLTMGAKAKDTGRAGAAAQLVRTGCNAAVLNGECRRLAR